MTELRIVMNDAGQIGVSGPIENVLVCYGLLELARDAIREHAAAAAARKIAPATGADIRALNGQRTGG